MASEEFMECTPPHLQEDAENATADLLPSKSKEKYEAVYEAFQKWRSDNHTTSCSENTLLAYFKMQNESKKPSSLWSIYSMLKKTLLLKEKQDISTFGMLTAYLKKQSVGFEPTKSAVFSKAEVTQFLSTAPDVDYLAMKVALIIGIMGACRSQELADIKNEDLKEEGNLIVITLPKTKTNKKRTFVIAEEYVDVVKKYRNARPPKTCLERFFVNYKKGVCTNQVIGKHTIAKMPKLIALYLNLENANTYTGHCFRRTAATIFANEGGNMLDLKELGGWKSDKVAQGYVQDSVHNKSKISNLLTSALNLPEKTNCESLTSVTHEIIESKIETREKSRSIVRSSSQTITLPSKSDRMVLKNCVVHIHNYQNK